MNSRLTSILLAACAMLGLGGCASQLTKQDMLAQFEPGEQKLYAIAGKSVALDQLTDFNDFKLTCGHQPLPDVVSPSSNQWLIDNVCHDMEKWTFVAYVYQTKNLKFGRAYAPAHMKIETDDILEISKDTTIHGQLRRPDIVTRIARKAKDANKETGCYWDGGKWATASFVKGGVICDGWNWRDQKFAKE